MVLIINQFVIISIHALREEGDLVWCLSSISSSLFQSTPSARRATEGVIAGQLAPVISIHALREEGDLFFVHIGDFTEAFQSTPSARRATLRYGKPARAI